MLGKDHRGLYKASTMEERRKRKATRRERSDKSLLILDLNDGRLSDSGKQDEGKRLHKLHDLEMNEDLRNRVRGLSSETWKGRE